MPRACEQLGALIALLMLVDTVSAQENVPLAWQFTAGNSFFVERSVTAEQKMRLNGVDVAQAQTQVMWTEWTPQPPREGNWVITVRIRAIKYDIQFGENRIVYDSRAKHSPG
jgi:hypothetical protein